MCVDGSTDTTKTKQKLHFQVNEFDSGIGPRQRIGHVEM